MNKRIAIVLAIFISILILFGLFQQILKALQSGGILDQKAAELGKVQEENRKLKLKLEETENYQFIERVARDKLNLARENEVIVIIPQEKIDKIINSNRPLPEIKVPNWQGWFKLFIN